MPKRMIIIGGGIAGLSTAIALKRKGIEAHIYEQAPELRETGAGLGINANMFKAMESLQLGQKLLGIGKHLASATIYTESGQLITKTDAPRSTSKFGMDTITLHRADLLHILADAFPHECVFTNKTCVDITEQTDYVSVKFQDGTVAEGDGLIAADGIRSLIRQKFLPDSKPRYAGYTCWRAVVSGVPKDYEVQTFSVAWGPQGRFGMVPLQNNRIYWFACVNAAPKDPRYSSFRVKDLQEHFGSYYAPIPDILARTDDSALIWSDIYDIKPLRQFAFGRTVLVGDAAHATTPNLGQGAGQALEDAVVLANGLARPVTVQEAFRLYESKRIARTRKVIQLSRTLGRVGQIDIPWICGIRNSILRIVPKRFSERQLDFLYNIEFD